MEPGDYRASKLDAGVGPHPRRGGDEISVFAEAGFRAFSGLITVLGSGCNVEGFGIDIGSFRDCIG